MSFYKPENYWRLLQNRMDALLQNHFILFFASFIRLWFENRRE